MGLKEKLNERKSQFEKSAPPEALTVMHKATEDLKNSKIMSRVSKKGDVASGFSLPDQDENAVVLEALLKKGPVVISFFRGVW